MCPNLETFGRKYDEIKRSQKEILDSQKGDIFVQIMSSPFPQGVRTEINGSTIRFIDYVNFKKATQFLDKMDATFCTDHIPILMNFMPEIILFRKVFSAMHNEGNSDQIYSYYFGSSIGIIPQMKFLAGYTKHPNGKERDRSKAPESIELAENLIKAILTVQDQDIMSFTIDSLLEYIFILQKYMDGKEEEVFSKRKRRFADKIRLCHKYGLAESFVHRTRAFVSSVIWIFCYNDVRRFINAL
jgi:hypothetical protein